VQVARFDLLILGDANPDLVMHGADVQPAFGQAEHLVDQGVLTLGGSGAIMACGAAKLGLKVTLVAVIGEDLFGAFVRQRLDESGVDTSLLISDPNLATGVSVILSGPRDRAILTAQGTIGELSADRIDRSVFASVRHVHVSSYYLQRRLSLDLAELFDQIHADGATTSVDPNWDPSDTWDGGLADLLPSVDVFLPNEIEALRMARISDREAAAQRLLHPGGVVVIKLGQAGAMAASDEGVLYSAGFGTDTVDTTGAGDAFDAGFLTGWLSRWPLERSLRYANICGSLSTRSIGGTEGQPSPAEADRALAEASVTR
jgi:sugar/nucleoside kinase (ribokinase family)